MRDTTSTFLAMGYVHGTPVRFFRPPDLPDQPWVAWSDILTATTPAELHDHFTDVLKRYGSAQISHLMGDCGPMMIVSHPPACGLAIFASTLSRAHRFTTIEFLEASADAIERLVAGMTVRDARMFIRAASCRRRRSHG